MTRELARSSSGRDDDQQVCFANVDYGPEFIETELDSTVAAMAVCEYISRHRDEHQGFVVACFDDPGMPAASELTAKPVVGIAQAAAAFATGLGKVGVLVVREGATGRVRETLSKYSVDPSSMVVESIGLGVHGLSESQGDDLIVDKAQALVARGAEVLLLACAGFSSTAKEIGSACGVPVLDGVSCGIEMVKARLSLKEAGLWPGRRRTGPVPASQILGSRTPSIPWATTG